jgi:hypothetical protein
MIPFMLAADGPPRRSGVPPWHGGAAVLARRRPRPAPDARGTGDAAWRRLFASHAAPRLVRLCSDPNRKEFVMRCAHVAGLVLVAGLGAALAGGLAAAPDEAKPAAEAGWTAIFNGKDLEGWKPQGDAVWKVEDGCLVGAPADAKGGDIFTTKEWDNFELRFTYKAVWPANSGVWFRTQYQFDILEWKDPVAYSGTLYCPNKMFIFKNLDKSLENREGWNEGQVYANGDCIIQWLNGKKIGECRDASFAKGKVGVQVHGGREFANMKIIIRKIEIRPLAKDDKPTEPSPPKAGRM